MAKRITNYSKLSKERKEEINTLLKASELRIIEVNSKKGVIIGLDEEEMFVVLDTWSGFDKRSISDEENEEDDDDDDDDDDEFEDKNLSDNLLEENNN